MPRTILIQIVTIMLATLPASGFASSPLAAQKLSQAQSACTTSGGKFDAGQAVQHMDVNGDGQDDLIIDADQFSCSTAPNMFRGTGGSELTIKVGDVVIEELAQRWEIIDLFNHKLLLLGRHGGFCKQPGFVACFEALVFHEGAWQTVGPRD